MQIPENREEDIFPREGIRIFLFKERKIVAFSLVYGHRKELLNLFG
jgi:hypothetical protein